MKKTSIYLLSLVVIGVLLLSILMPTQRIISLSIDTFQSAIANKNNEKKAKVIPAQPDSEASISVTAPAKESHGNDDRFTPIHVQFQPSTKVLLNPQDSIAFSDGRKIPYIINDVILMAPSDRIPDWMKWVFVVLAPLQLVLIILIIWKLIRFIINVSKEQIFVSRNVRYLRQVSTFLLIIALIQICEGLCKSKIFSIYELTTSGYNLSSTWDFSWNLLIMATLGFLFAQIWSYGIQIKEDQELTI